MLEPKRKTAMISSTSVDLPDHRREAMDACLHQGIRPIAMEHLPARDADAIRVSLEMVDEADIYIGIYAWRYGYIKDTYLEKHRLRQCADPRAGHFLRRLVQVRSSRVLISTRLYPAELQTNTALPRPSCYPLFLTGSGF
jgi:hypothetical protein